PIRQRTGPADQGRRSWSYSLLCLSVGCPKWAGSGARRAVDAGRTRPPRLTCRCSYSADEAIQVAAYSTLQRHTRRMAQPRLLQTRRVAHTAAFVTGKVVAAAAPIALP